MNIIYEIILLILLYFYDIIKLIFRENIISVMKKLSFIDHFHTHCHLFLALRF